MVKVTDMVVEDFSESERKIIASLMADTPSEVDAIGNDGSKIDNLIKGDVLTLGSTCLCATGEFGILDSTGKWNW